MQPSCSWLYGLACEGYEDFEVEVADFLDVCGEIQGQCCLPHFVWAYWKVSFRSQLRVRYCDASGGSGSFMRMVRVTASLPLFCR